MRKLKYLLGEVKILFSLNPNKTTDTTATTGNDLSAEMKTFYSEYLVKLLGPLLIHDQFGLKEDIPRNGGKTIEWRKFAPLPKMTTPLLEGVTPNGQKLTVTAITATIAQYGAYITITDVLDATAYDKIKLEGTEMLSDQAGKTLDTITRDIITAGTNVIFAGGKLSRAALVQTTDKLTVDDVRKAVRKLKLHNAPKFGKFYAGIIHPDIDYDIMDDNLWKYPHQYQDTENVYYGEIGELYGVRFSETTEAKVFHAEDLTSTARNLTVYSYSSKVITIKETLSTDDATAIVGRKINIGSAVYTISAASGSSSANTATITITETPASNPAQNDVIYPGEQGKAGANVYATMIIGQKAYGVTTVTGESLKHIAKGFGSAGTEDPLDQRATIGWKAMKTAARLVEQYMVRIESTSSFTTTEAN